MSTSWLHSIVIGLSLLLAPITSCEEAKADPTEQTEREQVPGSDPGLMPRIISDGTPRTSQNLSSDEEYLRGGKIRDRPVAITSSRPGTDISQMDATKIREIKNIEELKLETTKLKIDYYYWNTLLSVVIVSVFVGFYCIMHLFGKDDKNFSRNFIVIISIGTTIFLMVMGYTETQVAPAFGLLGTILGYIFGKQAGESNSK